MPAKRWRVVNTTGKQEHSTTVRQASWRKAAQEVDTFRSSILLFPRIGVLVPKTSLLVRVTRILLLALKEATHSGATRFWRQLK